MNANRRFRLTEGEFCVSLTAGREIGQSDFLLLQRDASFVVRDPAQVIPPKSVGGKIVASLKQDAECIRMIFYR